MKVRWTEEARRQLATIRDYIAEDKPRAADTVVAELIERGELLGRFPRLGRVVPEYGVDELREIVEAPYRIVYRLVRGRVEILTVFEGHRQFPLERLRPLPKKT